MAQAMITQAKYSEMINIAIEELGKESFFYNDVLDYCAVKFDAYDPRILLRQLEIICRRRLRAGTLYRRQAAEEDGNS